LVHRAMNHPNGIVLLRTPSEIHAAEAEWTYLHTGSPQRTVFHRIVSLHRSGIGGRSVASHRWFDATAFSPLARLRCGGTTRSCLPSCVCLCVIRPPERLHPGTWLPPFGRSVFCHKRSRTSRQS